MFHVKPRRPAEPAGSIGADRPPVASSDGQPSPTGACGRRRPASSGASPGPVDVIARRSRTRARRPGGRVRRVRRGRPADRRRPYAVAGGPGPTRSRDGRRAGRARRAHQPHRRVDDAVADLRRRPAAPSRRSDGPRRRPARSSARSPLSASRLPPGRTSGRHQPASRSSGATARAVTTSPSSCRASSSARPARTSTLVEPERGRPPRQEGDPAQQRLDQQDRQVRAGPAPARCPGSPAPEPTSTTGRAAAGSSTTTGAVEQVALPQPGRLARARAARARRRRPRAAAAYASARRQLRSPKHRGCRRFQREASITRSAVGAACGQAGRTTTRRWGSSPSDSLRSPAAATASWTTLRSNGVIGASRTGSPGLAPCSAVVAAELGELRPCGRRGSRRCPASAGCGRRSRVRRRAG